MADDSDAADAKTYYVDASKTDDTGNGLSEGNAFKTIGKAIETANSGDTILLVDDLGTENTVNCDKYLLNGHLEKAIKVDKSLTIGSADGVKKKIPYALWICEETYTENGKTEYRGIEVTLDNLVIDPVGNDYAIGVGQIAAKKLTVTNCEIKVQPYAVGSDSQVAGVYVYQSNTAVTIQNSAFTIDGGIGNGYVTAVMLWQGTATITGNTVDGYSKFLNIDGLSEIVVKNNTAKNMLGPITTSKGELKNGTFIQLATTSGASNNKEYNVTGNTIESSCDDDFMGIATYPISETREDTGTIKQNTPTKLNGFTTDMDVVFRGIVTVEKATITGSISLISENGIDAKVTVTGKIDAKDQSLSIAKDCSMILTGNQASINTNAKTGDGFLAVDKNVPEANIPDGAVGAYEVTIAIGDNNLDSSNAISDRNIYAVGETVTVTGITAKTNYKVGSVSYNGHPATAEDGAYTFVMPAENVTVDATAVGKYTATFVLNYDDGTPSKTWKVPFAQKEDVDLKAYTQEGYEFGGWSPSSIEDGKDITVTGTMKKLYAIEAPETSELGSVSVADSATKGEKVTITVTPETSKNAIFKSLTVTGADGKTVELTTVTEKSVYAFFMPAQKVTVDAVFAETYSVATGEASDKDATVTIKVGDKTLTGSDRIEVGTNVAVTVTESVEDKVIAKVYYEDPEKNEIELRVADGKYSFVMPAYDVKIVVVLGQLHNITIDSITGGTVAVDAENKKAAAGATITVTVAAADATYEFNDLSIKNGTKPVDKVTVEEGKKYTFVMPDADVTISAVFDKYIDVKPITVIGGILDESEFTHVKVGEDDKVVINFGKTDKGLRLSKITVKYVDSKLTGPTGYDYDASLTTEQKWTIVGTVATLDTAELTGNISVEFTFEKIPTTTVVAEKSDLGTIEFYSDKDCSSKISGENVKTGEKVYIKVSPNGENQLVSAFANDGSKDIGLVVVTAPKDSQPAVYELDTTGYGDKTVTITAEFKLVPYKVTIKNVANVDITVVGQDGKLVADGAEVPYGTELTVTAAPVKDSKYVVTGIKVGDETHEGSEYTFTVTSDVTISAVAEEPVSVSIKGVVEADGTLTVMNGKTEVKDNDTVPYGTQLTVSFELKNTEKYTGMVVKFNGGIVNSGDVVPVEDEAKFEVEYVNGYIVDASKIENAKVDVKPSFGSEGDEMKVTVSDVKEGYVFKELFYMNGTEKVSIPMTASEDMKTFTGTFNMPAENVVLQAQFDEPKDVVPAEENDDAKVVVDKDKAGIGQTITVTVTVKDKHADYYEGITVNKVVYTTTPVEGKEGVYTCAIEITEELYNKATDGKFVIAASFPGIEYKIDVEKNANAQIGLSADKAEQGKEVTITIVVADGYSIKTLKVGNAAYKAEVLTPAGLNTWTYKYKMLASDVTVSVELDTVDYKNATISGELTGKTTSFDENQVVTVTGDLTLTDGTIITVNGKLVVPAGMTVTVAAGSKLIINGYADIKGDIVIEEAETDGETPAAAGEILVKNNGQADVFGNVTISGVIGTEGTGKIVFKSGSAAEVSTGADVSATISEAGTIYGNVSIEEDASLTIAGKIGTATKFAVEGTLVVDTVVLTDGFSVDIAKDGQLQIENVVLGNNKQIDITGSELTYTDKDGKLVQKGDKNAVTVKAAASTTATTSDAYGALVTGITVSQKASSAVVKSTDSDKDLKDKYRNSYVLTVAGDIAVEGYSYAEQDAPEITATLTVAVSGASGAAKTNAVVGESSLAAGVTMTTAGKVSVEGAVTVGAGAAFTNSGDLTVKAAVDATAKADTKSNAAFTNNGILTVSGEGSIVKIDTKIAGNGTFNAAYYEVTDKSGKTSVTYYNYVTIDAALKAVNDGKTKEVTVYGKQTLAADANVPADVVVTLKKNDNADYNAVLTVAEEATLSFDASKKTAVKFEDGTKIVVKGTLSAEKMSNISDVTKIESDVITATKKADGTGYDTSKAAEWTNVYNALANAKAGSTVTLAKTVELSKNLVVPTDVTLDAAGFGITVKNDIALTVKGTLDLRNSTSKVVLASEQKNAETGKVEKKAGEIAVEGYVAYGTQAEVPVTGGNTIPGAYYSVTNDKNETVKYLTSYANGIADAAKADGYTGTDGQKTHIVDLVAGTDGRISLGDFSVTGEKDAPVILFVEDADLIVGTATFTYAAIITYCDVEDETHEISGVFADANGSVAVKAKSDDFTVGSIDFAGVATLFVSATIDDYQTEKGVDVDTYVIFSGKVLIDDLTANVDKAVFSASADVAIGYTEEEVDYGAEVSFGDKTEVSVEGAVAIKAGSTMTAEKLSVSGSIGIENGKLVAAEATVAGSIDAKAEKASAEFDVLYVGVDKTILGKEYVAPTSGDASVVGNVSVEKYILAAPAAVLPEDVVKEDSDYKCTVFNVDDAVYLRGYTPNINAAPEIYQVVYSKVDARFDGWYVSEDKIATTEKIGEVASVSAKITEDIYVMQITTDGGINYITVDGKLMTGVGNVFTITGLKAGNHVVKFEAKDGYDVSAVKMYAADGSVVDASKIALGGAKVAAYTGTETVAFELIGSTIAQPDTPEPTPIIIKDDKSDDMSLTDMLLIVLVVLIVIMAAIVALRMMRS